MRVLWTWSGVAALVLGVIVWGLIFWCCIRYRKRRATSCPRQIKYNFPLEIVCSIVPFLVIIGLFCRTVVVEDNVDKLTKNPDVLVAGRRVQVELAVRVPRLPRRRRRPTRTSRPYTESTANPDRPSGPLLPVHGRLRPRSRSW